MDKKKRFKWVLIGLVISFIILVNTNLWDKVILRFLKNNFNYLFFAYLAIMGLWGLYDHYIGSPKRKKEYEEKQKEIIAERKRQAEEQERKEREEFEQEEAERESRGEEIRIRLEPRILFYDVLNKFLDDKDIFFSEWDKMAILLLINADIPFIRYKDDIISREIRVNAVSNLNDRLLPFLEENFKVRFNEWKIDFDQSGNSFDSIKYDKNLEQFILNNYDEILQVFYFGGRGVKVADKAREAHTYIIGASKSGKSELIKDLIFTDFQRGNKSVILIEPHGDLAEQVAKLKDKDNKNLVYIDFTLDPEKTPVLNPFDISDRSSENIEIQAQALIDAFEDILGAEFSTQMEELLGATIRTLMQTGKGDFWELRRFMDDENNSDLVTAGKASPNPKDRLFFNDGSFNQQSYKPTKNSLKSKIGTYLGYAVFRNFTTGKSTIDLKKLTDGKKWIIFNLSKGNIGKKVSPILGRFVIASLQNIILQRAKTTHRTPVYLYIDEFQNYTSETIEEIFSESRKYGFHLTVAHQNTGQLLGKMKDLIFSNTSVKIVGRNDTEQLKKLSNQILTEFEELDKLTTGNFYMRVEKNEAQKIKVGTKLIDNKYSMTPQEWEQVKAEQLDEFYTKIEQREPPTISEPESEKFDFNPSDTV
jgi:molybdopterin converting factor small subunit